MDSLDVKILKEVIRNNVMPFPSPSLRKSLRTIGRNLRIDQGTVRNRIRKFKGKGLLNEFYLGVNPSLSDQRIAALWFDVHPQSAKDKVKTEVSSVKEALLVCDYLGPKLSCVFCYSDEDDLKKTARRITRIANSEEVTCQDKPFLPSRLKLSPSDWRIIHSLQQSDPSVKSFSIVAKETGLSTKTAKKRIQTMVEGGAIYLLANVNLGAFEGFVPADFTVFYEDPDLRSEINEKVRNYLGDEIVFADVEDRKHGYFALALPSVARIREIQRWTERIKGVAAVRLEILHGIVSIRRFYDELVKERIEMPIKVSARHALALN